MIVKTLLLGLLAVFTVALPTEDSAKDDTVLAGTSGSLTVCGTLYIPAKRPDQPQHSAIMMTGGCTQAQHELVYTLARIQPNCECMVFSNSDCGRDSAHETIPGPAVRSGLKVQSWGCRVTTVTAGNTGSEDTGDTVRARDDSGVTDSEDVEDSTAEKPTLANFQGIEDDKDAMETSLVDTPAEKEADKDVFALMNIEDLPVDNDPTHADTAGISLCGVLRDGPGRKHPEYKVGLWPVGRKCLTVTGESKSIATVYYGCICGIFSDPNCDRLSEVLAGPCQRQDLDIRSVMCRSNRG